MAHTIRRRSIVQPIRTAAMSTSSHARSRASARLGLLGGSRAARRLNAFCSYDYTLNTRSVAVRGRTASGRARRCRSGARRAADRPRRATTGHRRNATTTDHVPDPLRVALDVGPSPGGGVGRSIRAARPVSGASRFGRVANRTRCAGSDPAAGYRTTPTRFRAQRRSGSPRPRYPPRERSSARTPAATATNTTLPKDRDDADGAARPPAPPPPGASSDGVRRWRRCERTVRRARDNRRLRRGDPGGRKPTAPSPEGSSASGVERAVEAQQRLGERLRCLHRQEVARPSSLTVVTSCATWVTVSRVKLPRALIASTGTVSLLRAASSLTSSPSASIEL